MATPAITPALFSNPVTAVLGAGLLGTEIIGGIFSNHAKAVKTEAAALNTAVPEVQQTIVTTLTEEQTGQITPTQAEAVLGAIPNQYNAVVYGQFGVKQKSGNGPDVVNKDWITPWVTKAEGLIQSGQPGTLSFDAIPSHAGFAGLRSLDVNFQGTPWTVPSAVTPGGSSPPSIGVVNATGPLVSSPPDTSGYPAGIGTVGATIPAVSTVPGTSISWGSVLLWGGIILVAFWLLGGKKHR